ncbi:MAG: hypothetical protein FKY71_08685 [Spiribacter salinus]|uniref:Uncharacterized protein n=1 Tax=Spiribacter salinus TaxID=1335746 RepID=A0A540VRP3_9GAMM|nr:MAG: hypothetical protein FKY71_08685 [Spiribacter salinus]
MALEFVQHFGTGGSPSADVKEIGVTTLSLTTDWQQFDVTANLPSLAGKTLGADGNDYMAVIFWFDAGSSFNSRTNSLGQQSGTFDISRVQLEKSPVSTAFEIRPPGYELALCERYFEKGFTGVFQDVSISSGNDFRRGVYFSTAKRDAPSVQLSNAQTTNVALFEAENPVEGNFTFRYRTASAGGAVQARATYAADAEL